MQNTKNTGMYIHNRADAIELDESLAGNTAILDQILGGVEFKGDSVFTYDDNENITKITAGTKSISITYDAEEEVTKIVEDYDGRVITTTFTYDAEGILTGMKRV